MQIGITGLGRMGMGITKRLLRAGHQVVAHNRSPGPVEEAVAAGATGATSLADLVSKLKPPRVVWIMLPDGAVTEHAVEEASRLVGKGDIVIDGGNSNFKDDVRRAKALKEMGVHYVDIGTSGGVWGLERGFCMMVGGSVDAVKTLDPILRALAPGLGSIDRTKRDPNADERPELGYIHAGPAGAGHFVKMVHNGIEYGIMQAFAEGFDIMRCRNNEKLPDGESFDLNMADIAEVWRRGSVISSWLLDLTASALAKDPALNEFTGVVSDSGEGRWTIQAAIEEAVPANVLSAALYARFRSRQSATYGDKILSAMRKGFGGHVEPK
ncbi:MAG TPA: decarboxylating 6-phosphogluconate dehydrogenase [Caulobacterales bacterium]|nr:decarboxylating 6-phosphogluconate dehydrogenase [Caulobacterales bacterium]